MFELLTLGGVNLRGEEGEEIRSVLAQPKRLALLIYLALASPHPFQQRDTLLGLFWPEADQKHARAALRQALRYLRQALGEDVLINRGVGEIGIAEGAVYCDADAFERLLDEGDLESALALYRGNLLPGFFVTDAPGFERWLEAHRSRLRRAAVGVAWSVAASAEEEGRLDDAKQWARWAVKQAPADEMALRRLMAMLDRFGDRAAALHAFETFSRRMRAEYELEPSPETMALMEAIRARNTVDSDALLDTTDPVSVEDAAPTVDPQRVLVTVFENQTGDPSLDPVGSMAADWIAQGLSRVDELDVIPLTAAMASSRFAQRAAGGEGHAARVQVMAEETGAGTIVSGAYYASASRLQFQPRITNAMDGDILQTLAPVQAPVKAPLSAIEILQERVLLALVPRLDERTQHIRAAQQPPSYEAYRTYIEGMQHFIRGAWKDALASFQRSVAIDPDYELPLIVSAIAHWNLGELAAADAIAHQVDVHREELGTFEHALLDMVRAWLRGDWGAAHEAAMRQARLAPGSIAHFQVAEEARRLNQPEKAVDILTQIDPNRGEMRGWIFYWLELTRAYHRLGHHRRELEAAQKARVCHPNHPVAQLMELRALSALGRVEEVQRCLNQSLARPQGRVPQPGALMREAALELRAHGCPELAQELFKRSLDWYCDRPAHEQSSPAHRRSLARACYYAGRWEEAQALFEDLASDEADASAAFHHGRLQVHLDLGYLGALAIRRHDPERVEQIEKELATLPRSYLFGKNTYWRAVMAALREEKAQAVALLRQAFGEGLPHEIFIHTDMHFEALHTYPTFRELMQPNG